MHRPQFIGVPGLASTPCDEQNCGRLLKVDHAAHGYGRLLKVDHAVGRAQNWASELPEGSHPGPTPNTTFQ